ncbi:MAG: hypothetical protein ACK4UY_06205 [Dietzia sp.]
MHSGNQVPGYEVRIGLVQTPEVPPDLHVEIRGLDVLGQIRLVDAGGLSGVLTGPPDGTPIVTRTPTTTGVGTGGAAAAVDTGAAAILSGPRCAGALSSGSASFTLTAGRRGAAGSLTAGLAGARPVVALAATFAEGTVVLTTAAGGPVTSTRYVTVASSGDTIWLF